MPRKKATEEQQRVKWTIRIRPDVKRAAMTYAAAAGVDIALAFEQALLEFFERKGFDPDAVWVKKKGAGPS